MPKLKIRTTQENVSEPLVDVNLISSSLNVPIETLESHIQEFKKDFESFGELVTHNNILFLNKQQALFLTMLIVDDDNEELNKRKFKLVNTFISMREELTARYNNLEHLPDSLKNFVNQSKRVGDNTPYEYFRVSEYSQEPVVLFFMKRLGISDLKESLGRTPFINTSFYKILRILETSQNNLILEDIYSEIDNFLRLMIDLMGLEALPTSSHECLPTKQE